MVSSSVSPQVPHFISVMRLHLVPRSALSVHWIVLGFSSLVSPLISPSASAFVFSRWQHVHILCIRFTFVFSFCFFRAFCDATLRHAKMCISGASVSPLVSPLVSANPLHADTRNCCIGLSFGFSFGFSFDLCAATSRHANTCTSLALFAPSVSSFVSPLVSMMRRHLMPRHALLVPWIVLGVSPLVFSFGFCRATSRPTMPCLVGAWHSQGE